MVSPGVRRRIESLRENGGGRVYVVAELTPREAVVLIVPGDCESEDTLNPMCAKVDGVTPVLDALRAGDWSMVTRPMLVTVVADDLPPIEVPPASRVPS